MPIFPLPALAIGLVRTYTLRDLTIPGPAQRVNMSRKALQNLLFAVFAGLTAYVAFGGGI